MCFPLVTATLYLNAIDVILSRNLLRFDCDVPGDLPLREK